jgi:hypothetical protein
MFSAVTHPCLLNPQIPSFTYALCSVPCICLVFSLLKPPFDLNNSFTFHPLLHLLLHFPSQLSTSILSCLLALGTGLACIKGHACQLNNIVKFLLLPICPV